MSDDTVLDALNLTDESETFAQHPTAITRGGSAFDFMTLSMHANAASGSGLFRTQHSQILMLADEILVLATGGRDNALEIRNALTTLTAHMTVHLSMEEHVIYKGMAQEQRAKAIADQFERELSPVRSGFQSLMKKYAAPSLVAADLPSFNRDMEELVRTLTDLFKHEERELYVAFDRLVSGRRAA